MKLLYYFFLLSACPIFTMEKADQFCPKVLARIDADIEIMIIRAEITASAPATNGCLQIYKKLKAEMQKGHEVFAHGDPEAVKILQECKKRVTQKPEYTKDLEEVRKINNEQAWTAFRIVTMFECMKVLKEKGISYDGTFKEFFDRNEKLDAEKDCALVKGAILSLYLPHQIQASSTDIPF